MCIRDREHGSHEYKFFSNLCAKQYMTLADCISDDELCDTIFCSTVVLCPIIKFVPDNSLNFERTKRVVSFNLTV